MAGRVYPGETGRYRGDLVAYQRLTNRVAASTGLVDSDAASSLITCFRLQTNARGSLDLPS